MSATSLNSYGFAFSSDFALGTRIEIALMARKG